MYTLAHWKVWVKLNGSPRAYVVSNHIAGISRLRIQLSQLHAPTLGLQYGWNTVGNYVFNGNFPCFFPLIRYKPCLIVFLASPEVFFNLKLNECKWFTGI